MHLFRQFSLFFMEQEVSEYTVFGKADVEIGLKRLPLK